jgi:excisionase family DNA binding protein
MSLANYVSVYDFARELGITVGYVYKSIQEGRIPAKKVGRKWQIKKTELEARKP